LSYALSLLFYRKSFLELRTVKTTAENILEDIFTLGRVCKSNKQFSAVTTTRALARPRL
jgi:hypothetical protein